MAKVFVNELIDENDEPVYVLYFAGQFHRPIVVLEKHEVKAIIRKIAEYYPSLMEV